MLGGKLEDIRVLTGNVGGSFGMKASVYPEYIAMLHAARALGRPVKWTDERGESFVSDSHGRDHDMTGELALDRDGHILALRFTGFGNLGAYLSNATVLPSTGNVVKNSIGVYRTPLIEVNTRCVFTNTTPVGPYRGAGRPEANYYTERLLDTAAREMGIDRIELRRRNHITPDMLPHAAPSGMSYDSGDFPTVLDQRAGLRRCRRFRRAPRREPPSRPAARPRHRPVSGSDRGTRQRDGRHPLRRRWRCHDHHRHARSRPGPRLALRAGADGAAGRAVRAHPPAPGRHRRAGGRRRHRRLAVDHDQRCGDLGGERPRDRARPADRGARAGGGARRHRVHARHAGGRFSIAGTDRGIGIMELAEQLRAGTLALPEGVAPTLDVTHIHKEKASAFPNGCHVAEVEIDPETGVVAVVRYAMVNDFGVMVNPLLVEGQADGGVVQGIGQALLERVAYDADGQLLTGSYMDYGLPRADDAPSLSFASHPVPARTNILGAKGCGEAGCAGALPALMNAVVDALSEFGITHLDMPASPQRVWQAIEAARRQQAA